MMDLRLDWLERVLEQLAGTGTDVGRWEADLRRVEAEVREAAAGAGLCVRCASPGGDYPCGCGLPPGEVEMVCQHCVRHGCDLESPRCHRP